MPAHPQRRSHDFQRAGVIAALVTGTFLSTARARVMLEEMNTENWQTVRVEVLKLLTPVAPPSRVLGELFWGTPLKNALTRYYPQSGCVDA